MLRILDSVRISRKLPTLMLALTLAAILGMGYISFRTAGDIIKTEAQERLTSLAESKAQAVQTFFGTIANNLIINAGDSITAEALISFSDVFERLENPMTDLQRVYIDENPNPVGKKDLLVDADFDNPYARVHSRYHEHFHRIQQSYGYYDVFLFDTVGNLVYSVFKERDYATNMNTGEWKDTDLAVIFRRAMDVGATDASVFEDFEAYAPSYDAPASFIGRSVFDQSGQRLGVLAYQMPVDKINTAVANVTGLGVTGEVFLVGTDGLLRSGSSKDTESKILKTEVKNKAISAAFDGSPTAEYHANANGQEGLWYATPISFLGTTWAMAVTQETAELFAPLEMMRKDYFIKATILTVLSFVISLLASRNITVPLSGVKQAMSEIANRAYDVDVPATSRGDEIGEIGRTLERFRQSLIQAEAVAQEAAFKGAGFETSGAPMLMTDVNFTIIYTNAALKRMMNDRLEEFSSVAENFNPHDLIGKNMDMFHDLPSKARESLENPENLPFKIKLRIKDTYIGLLVDAVRNPDGDLIGFVLEWKDQTYQMTMQAVHKAIDASQCRVELRTDGRIKDANTAFCDLIGVSSATIIDMPGRELVAFEADGSTRQSGWEDVINGQAVFGTFQVNGKGQPRILEGSLSPVPDEKGATGSLLLIGVDVTDQRKAMQNAEEQQRKITEAQQTVVDNLTICLASLSSGDLTTHIDTTFSEDYEQLRADFNQAVSALRDAIIVVADNTSTINGEANGISAAADQLARRIEKQAASLQVSAGSLEVLAGSVRTSAEEAIEAASIVDEARKGAEQSGDVVREAVVAMNEIETSSQSVSKIVSVIEGIAFQTNLLALNAGVEAARAGESGRGFAVVASEVRALALRSSEAAQEIGALISASGSQITRGVLLVREAGDSLERIVASVNNIAGHVKSIAQSSETQAATLGEISGAIQEQDQATQRNAAMIEETTAASHVLTREAKTLAQTVSQFRILTEEGARLASGRQSGAVSEGQTARLRRA